MGHDQNSFRFACAFNTCMGGGILVIKINVGDWPTPYGESILFDDGNWKFNTELVQNFPYVLHNIVAVMCHVPVYISKGR